MASRPCARYAPRPNLVTAYVRLLLHANRITSGAMAETPDGASAATPASRRNVKSQIRNGLDLMQPLLGVCRSGPLSRRAAGLSASRLKGGPELNPEWAVSL
jgi:hypothetical protein